jgi:hypothetical protein
MRGASSNSSRYAALPQHSGRMLPARHAGAGRSKNMDIIGIVMLSSVALWILQQFDRQS